MSATKLPSIAVPRSGPTPVDGFIEYWAKSRIDQPREVIARHDEAAKQLIAVSAFLQAAYLAVFTFGDLKGRVPLWLLLLMFSPLLSVVVCAATVICTVPTDMNVHKALALLTGSGVSGTYSNAIDDAIKTWCEELDHLARKKARWLHIGNLSFIAASVVTVGVLIAAGMM